jgi:hypothetical protein
MILTVRSQSLVGDQKEKLSNCVLYQQHWAYILIYVDDILCVHHDPRAPLVKVDEYFKMK